MSVAIVTEAKEKEVTLLKNANVEFISLVRHGANRMPFRVIKQEGGIKNKMLAIQSIILPNGVKLDDLATKDFGFLSEAKSDTVQKFDGYSKLEQLGTEKFDPATMAMLKIGDGFILTGELKEKVEDAITLGKEEVEKLSSLPAAPMDAMITNDGVVTSQTAIAVSFRDIYEKELYSMLDVIHGSLNQSASDPKKRKSAIIQAVDSFKSFLSAGLDAIGAASAKLEKFNSIEGGFETMFKTKEEFVEAVSVVVNGVLKANQEAEKAATEKAAADAAAAAETTETPGAKKVVAPVKEDKTDIQAVKTETPAEDAAPKWATDLQASVEAISDKVVKMESGELDTQPIATEDTDLENIEKKEEGGVFAGLIVNRQAA